MGTLLRKQQVVGGQLDLGRMSTVLECSISRATVNAIEGEAQIVRSSLRGCDLRRVPAAAFDDCDLHDCELPRGVDDRRNRIRARAR